MSPYFSLILPCYNVGNYVARCVQSILSQDFTDYEIILVDDGSTDDTPAQCDQLAAEHGCIRVLHKENGGLSSARNAGLDVAHGEYVWFVDADDWIEPGSLALLHQASEDGAIDVVKFDHYRVEGAAHAVRCSVEPGLYAEKGMEELHRRALCRAGSYGLSACMHVYRRALLEEHELRFVSERQVGSEDYLFNLQVLLHAAQMRVLDAPLYSYERREGSLTQTYKADLAQRYGVLRQMLRDYYQAQGALECYDALLERFFLLHLIIGTCVTQEYAVRPDGEARQGVRRLLKMPEARQAVWRADRSGLNWKKKTLLAAFLLHLETVFHRVYGGKH